MKPFFSRNLAILWPAKLRPGWGVVEWKGRPPLACSRGGLLPAARLQEKREEYGPAILATRGAHRRKAGLEKAYLARGAILE